nr:hypothetical protein [Tanacetum cinerariifolium]
MIDEAQYQALLKIDVSSPSDEFFTLHILGCKLRNALLFKPKGDARWIAYLPGESDNVVQSFASLDQLTQVLRTRLRDEAYQRYVDRFIPERSKAVFFQRLRERLAPHVLHSVARGTGFHRQLISVAEVDEKAELDLEAISLGGSLGAQLLDETFEGVDAWRHGDMDQALEHLGNVAENLVLMGAMGAAGGATHAMTADAAILQPPSFIKRSVLARDPVGRLRLADPAVALRRLHPDLAELDDKSVARVMAVSGMDGEQLAALHIDEQPAPAALLDTAKRLRLRRNPAVSAQNFEEAYAASEQSSEPMIMLLRRDFPSLTLASAEALVAETSAEQRLAMSSTRRIPLEVAGKVRLHLRQTRMSRALEGFFDPRDTPGSDVQRLTLRSLATFPGWPADLRIEIREGVATGPVLDRIGAEHAARRRSLIKGANGFHLDGVAGPQPDTSLFSALLQALPEDIRQVEEMAQRGRPLPSLLAATNARALAYEQLHANLIAWAEADDMSVLLNDGERAARRQVAQVLSRAWRFSHDAAPRGSRWLTLEHTSLPELPPLHGFYADITRVELNHVQADTAAVNAFVAHFPNMTHLNVRGSFTEVPQGLLQLQFLEHLTLENMPWSISQPAMDRLMDIPALHSLSLAGTYLGEFSDTSRFRLSTLWINNTGLTQWPDWTRSLALAELDISDNHITEIAAEIVENPRDHERHTTLEDYWRNDTGYGHRYRLDFDFPDDIREIPVEGALTDSESDRESETSDDESASHAHRALSGRSAAAPSVQQWLRPGEDVLNRRLQEAWAQVAADGDAPHVLVLLQRLRETPDFSQFHAELAADVLSVLEAAAQDAALRGQLEVMANDRLFGANQTCQDGARLIFSDIQVAVYSRESLRGVAEARRTDALLGVMRQLFRLHEVQSLADAEIARRESLGVGVDHAEVRLAYRIGLADDLGLPGQPHRMVWARLAAVDRWVLLDARRRILEAERGPAFLQFAVSDQQWNARLRADHEAGLAAATASVRRRMAALEEHPPTDPDDYHRQGLALIAEREAAEALMLHQLTDLYRAGWEPCMFESAEIGHTIDDETYDSEVPSLREALLEAQYELHEQGKRQIIVLINGIEGAGKGETVKLLNEWMDPRYIEVRTFDQQTDEELAHPPRQMKLRLKTLKDDPLHSWRISPLDWQQSKTYDRFVRFGERVLRRTSRDYAPWHVIEGVDPNYRSLTVGRLLLEGLQNALRTPEGQTNLVGLGPLPNNSDELSLLDNLDMTLALEKDDYEEQLIAEQARLSGLMRDKRMRRHALVTVFEGNDAAGKGGAIKRVAAALDPRQYHIVPIAAPSQDELAQPYLWRFWRQIPARGKFTVFDRSCSGWRSTTRLNWSVFKRGRKCPSNATRSPRTTGATAASGRFTERRWETWWIAPAPKLPRGRWLRPTTSDGRG